MTYTPPPPAPPPPPPPRAVQTAGNDNTTLFGWIGIIGGLCCGIIGIIFGILSIMQARKVGKSPVLGIIAIVIGVITAISWPSVWFNR
jgi:predicted lipid-binding transport protein (Tim44 family)